MNSPAPLSTALALLGAAALLVCVNPKIAFATDVPAATGKMGDEYKAEKLYTPPDPAAMGGLRFTVVDPIAAAFAIPENNQFHVYKGTVSGAGREVSFTGLPIAKYDLVIEKPGAVYEGVVLNRDENNLTEKDLKFIAVTVNQSIPFFDLKKIHRVKGTTGTAGKGTALVQEVRTGRTGLILNQNGDNLKGHQIRSIKLEFVEDVGVAGWQVAQTREIIRTAVFPNMPKDCIPVSYVESLGGIRVTDSVKDLGSVKINP